MGGGRGQPTTAPARCLEAISRLQCWGRGAQNRAQRSCCNEELDPSAGRSWPLALMGQGIEGGLQRGSEYQRYAVG